jgi:hypothetical protein
MLRRVAAILVAFTLCSAPCTPAELVPTLRSQPTTILTYAGNHGFVHQTGQHHTNGWSAVFRKHPPGYLVRGLSSGGADLPEGVYRYVFHFLPANGTLPGIFWQANDVVRVEAWDVTTGEVLVSRTFQRADFKAAGDRPFRATLLFSTEQRTEHRFEPRIFWPGLASVQLERVELQRFETLAPSALKQKAADFEKQIGEEFISDGFVFARRGAVGWDDYGDTAIWTGLYAASQAWRYRATREREARKRLEDSLWSLHTLALAASPTGTLVRYPGEMATSSASRDTYTGFFFALAQALPAARDPRLRKALLRDAEALGHHFLDHDQTFVPTRGTALGLNPYPSKPELSEAISEIQRNSALRLQVIRIIQGVRLYGWFQGQKSWPGSEAFLDALRTNNPKAMERHFIPAVGGAFQALKRLQKNVSLLDRRSFVFGPTPQEIRHVAPDTPYAKLDAVLRRALENLRGPTGAGPKTLEDFKVMPSQSLHALHFLKVLGETLPKPNRFDSYYYDNLWHGRALLKTVLGWNEIDEALAEAINGRTRGAVARNSTRHLSYLALYNLIQLEKDPGVRQCYRAAFDRQFSYMQEDFNAMLHVMRHSLNLGPSQTGVGLWSLSLYPMDRRGLGHEYWTGRRHVLANRFGGLVGRQARDPVPLDERHRDSFIWQRGARSLGGDDADKRYPPIDFLFAYWMWRASGTR